MLTEQNLNRPQETSAPSAPGVIDRNRTLLGEAEAYVYKTINEYSLEAHVFKPKEGPTTARSAIAFFFSSGWDTGLISQFAPHCMYFSHRGMVAVLFDYRVFNRHLSTPLDAVADARSAIRWLRLNADQLGIDPDRIVAAGGSAGGQLAAATAMLKAFDDPADDTSVSCVPNALVLYNPILDTTRKKFEAEKFPSKALAKAASPMRHMARKLPPMLIIHGTGDRVVPFESSKKFVRKMRWRGNDCRIGKFDGCGHGFFNFNVDARLYELTTNAADAFLVEKGLLLPPENADSESRLATV